MPSESTRGPSQSPDLEAEVYVVPTEEGGRRSALFSGYRPSHDFGHSGALNDGMHEYPDGGSLTPGQKGRALIWLSVPELSAGRLYVGMPFTVQEGARVVGRGQIERVLNASLERAL